MDLKEIRAGYRDILNAFDELNPIQPREKVQEAILTPLQEGENFGSAETRSLRTARRIQKQKKRADESGNAQVWRRGDPVDGLSEGMKVRVEQAVKFGF